MLTKILIFSLGLAVGLLSDGFRRFVRTAEKISRHEDDT